MNNISLDSIIALLLSAALGMIAPFLLIPVVAVTGYSEAVEEFAKVLFVAAMFSLAAISGRERFLAGGVFGFFFAISEGVLYLSNFFQYDDPAFALTRLLATMPLHIITVMILVGIGSMNKKLLPIGWVLATAIHIAFNS